MALYGHRSKRLGSIRNVQVLALDGGEILDALKKSLVAHAALGDQARSHCPALISEITYLSTEYYYLIRE
jgi:hypothetical protein